MGLAPGGGTSSPPPSTSSPKTLTGLQLLQEAKSYKIAVLGDSGTGKTFTLPSLLEYLINDLKLPPLEILIEFIDLDAGLQELLEQGLVPPPLLERINYSLCSSFTEVSSFTKDAFIRLNNHIQSVGHNKGAYIIIDNMSKAWDWAQDSYSKAVYGKPMVELMKEARKSQVDAQTARSRGATNAKGKGVFNQYLDYAVINPLHNDWAEYFKTTGINYIWLSTWKWEDVKDENDNIIDTKLRFGQKDNEGRVSHIILKYYENKVKRENRRARFLKSRSSNLLPSNILDPTWSNIMSELHRVESMEREKHSAKDTSSKSNDPKPSKEVKW